MNKKSTLIVVVIVLFVQNYIYCQTNHFYTNDLFGKRVFIKNNGQYADLLSNGLKIDFAYSNAGEQVFFNKEGVTYFLEKEYHLTHEEFEELEHGKVVHPKPSKKAFVHVKWLNANPNLQIIESEKQRFYHSFGDKNLTSACFKKITYKNVYNNIDIEYLFTNERDNGLKYNIIVHPGGNVNDIKIKYSGDIKKIKIENNEVILKTSIIDVRELAPKSFQGTMEIPTNYILKDGVVSFELSNGYDSSKTLTIDPWVVNLTLNGNNFGFDVDYDFAGNYYVYGGSGPFFVSKYSPSGELLWTFDGEVPSQLWNSGGTNNYPSNFVVDKKNGKCYIGQGFVTGGARIVRINSSGLYDNFITKRYPNWLEVWDMGFRCSDDSIFGLGGTTQDNLSAGVFNENNTNIVPKNFTNNNSRFQDIASHTIDADGAVYVLYSSGSQFNNHILKTNETFDGNIWYKYSGFSSFSEAKNKPYYRAGENSNGYNALDANKDYLFYYDGVNLAAYNKLTGNKISNITVQNPKLIYQGGIASDICNNVYIGGIGKILSYHFDGIKFTLNGAIPLTNSANNKNVFDIKLNANTNELYVSGLDFGGIYDAIYTNNCSSLSTINESQTCIEKNNSTITFTVTTSIPNPILDYTLLNNNNYVVSQTLNSTSLTNSTPNLADGTYTLLMQINAPCGPIVSKTINIESKIITPEFSQVAAICFGESLSALPTTSINGLEGTWLPDLNNQQTTTYTFTPKPNSSFCKINIVTMTVTVNPIPNAGLDGTTSICEGSITNLKLSDFITNEDINGAWTRLTGAGGTLTNGVFDTRGLTSESTFEYKVNNQANCEDTSKLTLKIDTNPNAGLDNTTSICVGSILNLKLSDFITNEDTGGTWTRLTGTGGTLANGLFDTTGLTSESTFEYIVENDSNCQDRSILTLKMEVNPNAGLDGTTSICEGSIKNLNLSDFISNEDTGGTWTRLTGTGGTLANGFFDTTGLISESTFEYTVSNVANCKDKSKLTLKKDVNPNAGLDGTTSICEGTILNLKLSDFINNEDIGGTWTRLSGTGGTLINEFFDTTGLTSESTFEYRVGNDSNCNDKSILILKVNKSPNAGIDGLTSICEGNANTLNLIDFISNSDSGGSWRRLSGRGGTLSNGNFDATGMTSTSSFEYKVTNASNCEDTAKLIVKLNTNPNAGLDGTTSICKGSIKNLNLSDFITNQDLGGTWTRLTGTGGILTNGIFDTTGLISESTFEYQVKNTSNCLDNAILTLNIDANPNAGQDGTTSVCEGSTSLLNLFNFITSGQSGGEWTRLSGSGGNLRNGFFNPTGMITTSTFEYKVKNSSNCDDIAIVTVNLNRLPFAGNDIETSVCEDSIHSLNLSQFITSGDMGGLWKRLSGNGGTLINGVFNTSGMTSESTFEYLVTNASNCKDTAILTIKINPNPNAGMDNTIFICENSAKKLQLSDYILNGETGGNWFIFNGTGGMLLNGVFDTQGITSDIILEYKVRNFSNCVDSSFLTIKIIPNPNAGTDKHISFCEGTTPKLSLSGYINDGDGGGTWTRLSGTGGILTNGIFDTTGMTSESTFQYLVEHLGCLDEAILTISIDSLPVVDIGDKGIICLKNDGTVLNTFNLNTGLSPTVYNFKWKKDGVLLPLNSNNINVDQEGIYEVIVSKIISTNITNECFNSDTSTITSSVMPEIKSLVDSVYFSENNNISIISDPAGSEYEYSINDGPFQENNNFYNLSHGEQFGIVRNKNNCGSATFKFYFVNYPKFFTPNGDGENETWNITDLSNQHNSKIEIFDRYGKFIKQIRPSGTGWDGTFNGEALPAADYWFVVYYDEDGQVKTFKAHFSLKR